MANERIHMRKIKEAMRLLLGLKFSQAQTAKSLKALSPCWVIGTY